MEMEFIDPALKSWDRTDPAALFTSEVRKHVPEVRSPPFATLMCATVQDLDRAASSINQHYQRGSRAPRKARKARALMNTSRALAPRRALGTS